MTISPDLKRELQNMAQGSPVRDVEGWRVLYVLHKDFSGFSGHFPDYPLLPAVMQVFMGAHAVSLIEGVWPDIGGISVAKFTEQARPGETLQVCARKLLPETGGAVWDFTITKIQQEGSATPAGAPVATFKFSSRP